MSKVEQPVLRLEDYPNRLLLDQIADKGSVLVLAALCEAPLRFNALKGRLDGVTPKALTECLRRLERNGIVSRRVTGEYGITPLGRTLEGPFATLHAWAVDHLTDVELAQREYDGRTIG